MGLTLPREVRELLSTANGFMLPNGVGLYAADEIEERNSTLEVGLYAPGYLAIGDDSGGNCLLVHIGRAGLFVHMGIMDPDEMELCAGSLREWMAAGCTLPGQHQLP